MLHGNVPHWKKHRTICGGQGEAYRRLFPVMFSIMRLRVNTGRGNEESGLRLNTGLIVAPATTNGTTCSLRYLLWCLFLNPLQELLRPGSSKSVPAAWPRSHHARVFPREIWQMKCAVPWEGSGSTHNASPGPSSLCTALGILERKA